MTEEEMRLRDEEDARKMPGFSTQDEQPSFADRLWSAVKDTVGEGADIVKNIPSAAKAAYESPLGQAVTHLAPGNFDPIKAAALATPTFVSIAKDPLKSAIIGLEYTGAGALARQIPGLFTPEEKARQATLMGMTPEEQHKADRWAVVPLLADAGVAGLKALARPPPALAEKIGGGLAEVPFTKPGVTTEEQATKIKPKGMQMEGGVRDVETLDNNIREVRAQIERNEDKIASSGANEHMNTKYADDNAYLQQQLSKLQAEREQAVKQEAAKSVGGGKPDKPEQLDLFKGRSEMGVKFDEKGVPWPTDNKGNIIKGEPAVMPKVVADFFNTVMGQGPGSLSPEMRQATLQVYREMPDINFNDRAQMYEARRRIAEVAREITEKNKPSIAVEPTAFSPDDNRRAASFLSLLSNQGVELPPSGIKSVGWGELAPADISDAEKAALARRESSKLVTGAPVVGIKIDPETGREIPIFKRQKYGPTTRVVSEGPSIEKKGYDLFSTEAAKEELERIRRLSQLEGGIPLAPQEHRPPISINSSGQLTDNPKPRASNFAAEAPAMPDAPNPADIPRLQQHIQVTEAKIRNLADQNFQFRPNIPTGVEGKKAAALALQQAKQLQNAKNIWIAQQLEKQTAFARRQLEAAQGLLSTSYDKLFSSLAERDGFRAPEKLPAQSAARPEMTPQPTQLYPEARGQYMPPAPTEVYPEAAASVAPEERVSLEQLSRPSPSELGLQTEPGYTYRAPPPISSVPSTAWPVYAPIRSAPEGRLTGLRPIPTQELPQPERITASEFARREGVSPTDFKQNFVGEEQPFPSRLIDALDNKFIHRQLSIENEARVIGLARGPEAAQEYMGAEIAKMHADPEWQQLQEMKAKRPGRLDFDKL